MFYFCFLLCMREVIGVGSINYDDVPDNAIHSGVQKEVGLTELQT